MVDRKVDRRTQRTRAALLSAFVELILSRGYVAVTIGDIIRRANVGRSTFYLHYARKDALLKESLRHPCSALAACARGDTTARMLMPLLEHFREQRSLNRVLFEHPVRSLWVKSLAELIERNVAPMSGADRRRPPIPRSLHALTVAEMQIGLITHWLNGALSVKSDLIAEALVLNTRAMLARPAELRAGS
jgi:AcrR family transcriptional regulator